MIYTSIYEFKNSIHSLANQRQKNPENNELSRKESKLIPEAQELAVYHGRYSVLLQEDTMPITLSKL